MQVHVSKFEYVVKTYCFGVNTLLLHLCYIMDLHFTVK